MDKLIKQRFTELEAQANLIDQTREGEGVDHQTFHKWATSVYNLLMRVFGEDSPHYQNFDDLYKQFLGSHFYFLNCWGVFEAAKEDFEGGYLFNVRGLVRAEVLAGDVLGQATELLNAGYKDPACILARVALESTLKELCARTDNVEVGKLDKMNAELCKAGVYNMGKQKQITAWAHIGNDAAHGKFDTYDPADVNNFIQDVIRLIADFL